VPLFRRGPLEQREILAIVTVLACWALPAAMNLSATAMAQMYLLMIVAAAMFCASPLLWFALGCHVSFRFGVGVLGLILAPVLAIDAARFWLTQEWKWGAKLDEILAAKIVVALVWFLIFLVGQGARLVSRRRRSAAA
jgi:hypothetical protein